MNFEIFKDKFEGFIYDEYLKKSIVHFSKIIAVWVSTK